MRSFLSILSLLLVAANFSSCKKDTTSSVILEMNVVNDKAELSWKVIGDQENIHSYTIFVKTAENSEMELDQVTSMQRTVNLPVSSYVAYRVSANYNSEADDVTGIARRVYSNYKEHSRNDIKFLGVDPMDVLLDNAQLYIFDGNSTIAKYDVFTKQIVKQVNIGGTINYADMGIHNGQKEIYVPRTDGWIYVLNTNLEKTDAINVGAAAYSVVYHNGYLYTTVMAPGSGKKADGKPLHYNLHVYNRTTKQLVANSNNNIKEGPERIKKVSGTNVELFGVLGNVSANLGVNDYDLYYMKYDANGNYISHQKALAGNVVTPIIMEAYPDGSKIVTGIRGRIFNKNLVLEGMFSDTELSETYTSAFGFNAAQNLVYVGRSDRTIDVINMSDNSVQRTIKTTGHPHKIFFEAGNIICVSRNQFPATIGFLGTIPRSPFIVEVFQ